MLAILLKHKPKDISEEKFKEMWENSSYTLEPLLNAIKELMPKEVVKGDDFNSPNHYAKMVWQSGQRDFANKIMDLFPDSLKS